jgi:N6-L-threonylcarbamoyladenine synthase
MSIVLGIETSCDETAAALVNDQGEILADVVLSQLAEHRPFGGIVPEVAARSHLDHLDRLIKAAMEQADISFSQLDAVAATGGPGLIGGVMVGVMTGKAIASVINKPFLAVNHLEGHALTARLTHKIDFPYLLLLISGGHCQLLIVEGVGKYRRLGTTIDDAAGEAFDKVAKMLNLGYPGGPAIEQTAKNGDSGRFALPRPMKGKPNCDFSFSGLKTAVRQMLPAPLTAQDAADMAASFQMAVADAVADRCKRASRIFFEAHPEGLHLVVAGGVAANSALRSRLEKLAKEVGLELIAPPLKYCTDNAAMIAWAGIERLRLDQRDGMDFAPRPRWPLDPSAPKARFAGVKA